MREIARALFDDELKTMKRLRRKCEKAYRKIGNSQAKSRFLNSVLEYFQLFTKKSEYLGRCVASENECVKYSMLQLLLGKNNVVLPQSLRELECLAKKFAACFVKKIEAVLVSLPLTNGLELNDSHTTALDNFKVFTQRFVITTTKNFEQYGNECNTNGVMYNCFDKFSGLLHCVNQFNSTDRILSKSIQTRSREAAHTEV